MSERPPLRVSSAVATVVAATWIAIGAGYKWLAGNPGDLPSVLRVEWFDIVLLYKVAIGIELAVVAIALLAPVVGWLLLALQYVAFLVVLAVQVARGDANCGCFGSSVSIAPEVMMAIDGALLAALFFTRPWTANLWCAKVPVVLLVAALGLAAPWLHTRQLRDVPGENGDTPRAGFVIFDERTWPGKLVGDCDFAPYLDQPVDSLMPGVWVFYRLSCPACKDHLEAMIGADQQADPITLVRIPEPDLDPRAVVVQLKPSGAHVTEVSLRPGVEYVNTAPFDMRVEWSYLVSRVRLGRELEGDVDPFPTADPAVLEAAELEAAKQR